MIKLVGVKKAYKKIEAVKGINIEVKEGEILGLLGPNGAGKSTTISIIATLFPPTEGEVVYEGKDVVKNPKEIRKILGIVPQEIALYPELSAYENLKFFGKVYGLKGEFLESKIEEILEIIGMNEKAKSPVKTYSGGMKRRVNIGCALLHDPKLLIMDEPTVGIDPQSRSYILETVKRLNKEGMTILYTSHYMEEVEYLCDRIYIMDDGLVITEGTKEELKSGMTEEDTFVINLESISDKLVKEIKELQEVKSLLVENQSITINCKKNCDLLQKVLPIAQEFNCKVTSFSVKTPTLEDVFLSKTGRTLRE